MGGMGRKSDQDGIQIEPKIHRKAGKLEGWNNNRTIGTEMEWKGGGSLYPQYSIIPAFHDSIFQVR
jgi:hypothetical protein